MTTRGNITAAPTPPAAIELSAFDVFEAFPKIPRLRRTVMVTEKIDGTNAQVVISDDGEQLRAGSRKRWITPDDDNYGFAAWCEENRDELLRLGPGRHFGEWWGSGIQRGYGLQNGEKRFSLFNTSRWSNDETRPECCSIVPYMGAHENIEKIVSESLESLRTEGSRAAPGFMEPEGIVVFMAQAGQMFKVTLKNDALPKEVVEARERAERETKVWAKDSPLSVVPPISECEPGPEERVSEIEAELREAA